MDHAVTATQKIILKAFYMDADQIQDKAVGLRILGVRPHEIPIKRIKKN